MNGQWQRLHLTRMNTTPRTNKAGTVYHYTRSLGRCARLLRCLLLDSLVDGCWMHLDDGRWLQGAPVGGCWIRPDDGCCMRLNDGTVGCQLRPDDGCCMRLDDGWWLPGAPQWMLLDSPDRWVPEEDLSVSWADILFL